MWPPPAHPVGSVFKNLTVVGHLPKSKNGNRMYLVRCVCGKEKPMFAQSLQNSVSCGCVRSARTHGHARKRAKIPEYLVWCYMRKRCANKSDRRYSEYGGRGVFVCAAWEDFAAFFADMGRRPSPKHSLDRIDNNGPYSPENCRWATRSEQNNNQRRNVRVAFRGQSMTVAEWSRLLGINAKAVYQDISRGMAGDGAIAKQLSRLSSVKNGD